MLLVDYYRTAPDIVQFNQYWCPDTTMMDKIKVRSEYWVFMCHTLQSSSVTGTDPKW